MVCTRILDHCCNLLLRIQVIFYDYLYKVTVKKCFKHSVKLWLSRNIWGDIEEWYPFLGNTVQFLLWYNLLYTDSGSKLTCFTSLQIIQPSGLVCPSNHPKATEYCFSEWKGDGTVWARPRGWQMVCMHHAMSYHLGMYWGNWGWRLSLPPVSKMWECCAWSYKEDVQCIFIQLNKASTGETEFRLRMLFPVEPIWLSKNRNQWHIFIWIQN